MKLLVLLLLTEAGWLALLSAPAVDGAGPVLRFMGVLAGLFLLYALAACEVLRRAASSGTMALVLGGAVLFRATLLPVGLPLDTGPGRLAAAAQDDLAGRRVAFERFLLYDDDHWRYLWDGHVARSGVNPYRHAPVDAALDPLADEELWSDVRDFVSYAHLPTVYPPLAQWLFATAHAVAPGSVLVLKLLVVAADLIAGGFLLLALRRLGRPPALALLYLWNPLVIKVFAGSAHIDAVVVAALAALAWAVLAGRRVVGGVAFGAAVLAKLAPLVLLPLVVRRLGLRGLAVAGLVVGLGYAAYVEPGASPLGSFATFAGSWEFNGGLHRLLQATAAALPDPDRAARAAAGLLVLGWVAWRAWRDDGSPERFPAEAAAALGALLVASPAVMPWYVTWLVPFAILARSAAWLSFSGLVCLAFLFMIDGRERPVVLAAEYGLLAAALLREAGHRGVFSRFLVSQEAHT